MQRVELRCCGGKNRTATKCGRDNCFCYQMRTRSFGGEVEFVGGLDVEGGVPAVFVADGEGAVLAGGVGIGEDFLAQCGVTSD